MLCRVFRSKPKSCYPDGDSCRCLLLITASILSTLYSNLSAFPSFTNQKLVSQMCVKLNVGWVRLVRSPLMLLDPQLLNIQEKATAEHQFSCKVGRHIENDEKKWKATIFALQELYFDAVLPLSSRNEINTALWSTSHLKKPTFTRPFKKFLHFMESRIIIIVAIRADHLSQAWDKSIQCTPFRSTSLRSTLILQLCNTN